MQQEKPKAFIVKMSVKGLDVKIEPEEIEKVVNAIKSGGIAIVKQGIINTSFFAGIVEDTDRIKTYMEEVNRIADQNRKHEEYGIGNKGKIPEFEKLKNILEGVQLPQLNRKQLN